MTNEIAEIKNDVVTAPSTVLSVIERAAQNPDVDIEKMERLLQMHERLLASDAEKAFNKAMNVAQSEIRRIAADGKNNQTHSRYATYPALDKALRPIYTKHGFALSFDTGETVEGFVRVVCYVTHQAGHKHTYKTDMPADGKGAKGGDVMTKTHAVGSGIAYGMRYLLKMIFNVAVGDDDDDDGNQAGGRNIAEELLAYNETVREHFWTIAEVKRFLTPTHGENENQINVSAAKEAMSEVPHDDQRILWRAPTKGGIFTTQERTWLKVPPEDAL